MPQHSVGGSKSRTVLQRRCWFCNARQQCLMEWDREAITQSLWGLEEGQEHSQTPSCSASHQRPSAVRWQGVADTH